MELMLSKFDAFGESLSDVRVRMSRMEPDLHSVKEDVALLKSAVRTNGENIRTIKSDVAEIKADLKNYSQRLESVEAKS